MRLKRISKQKYALSFFFFFVFRNLLKKNLRRYIFDFDSKQIITEN